MSQNSKKQIKLVTKIITNLQQFIDSEETMQEYRTKDTFFTRESPLSFRLTTYLILSNLTNTLATELYKVFKTNDLDTFTKSAFSQRRYQIKPELFVKLNEILIEFFYQKKNTEIRYWNGFILTAIDGSSCMLPQTESVAAEFGKHKNGTKTKTVETIMGRFMAQYDVLNHIMVKSGMYSVNKSEHSITYDWVENLINNSLTIFDRGFDSTPLMYLMNLHKKDFLIRLKLNYRIITDEFVASGELDKIVTYTTEKKQKFGDRSIPKGTVITFRLVRVTLPNGEIEILATSLLDRERYPVSIFAELYHMRWGVETCFDRFKNSLLALCFCGQKAAAIYQEINAMVLDQNIHQLLVAPAQTIVNEKVAEKKEQGIELKHEQAVNNNVTIGILKIEFTELWLAENTSKIVRKLVLIFSQFTEPVRPKRSSKRKFKITLRRNLKTQTNYRRAA